ncbi:MAG TPA: hypothetical protein VHT91_12295 [Kofleriaceae bacterium]|jgi:hypothetical protein|nr:hypothetical protein [Kofleriaceae bacterium]
MKRSTHAVVLASLCLGGFAGCLASEDVDVGTPAPAQPALLYRDDLGNDHALEYHVLGRGILGVRETMPIDDGETSVLDKVGHAQSLTAVFQRIHPDVAAPQILVDADRDNAAQREQLANVPPPDISSLPANRPTQSSLTCSGDFFGDNWGANWFLQNFCTTGAFRECQTNLGWFDDWHQTSWNSYRQLEGDFSNNGHISGYSWSCNVFACSWSLVVDHDVLPRNVETWSITGASGGWVRFSGTSQCGHLGVAFLWNG